MRRLALFVLPALVAGSLLGGVALAQAGGGSDPEGDTPGRPDVFFLFADPNEDAEVVVPAAGGPPPEDPMASAAVGDVFINQDDLFALDPDTNGPTGDQLGVNNIHCTLVTLVERVSVDLLCYGVITLPRGAITWQAKLTFAEADPGEFVVPITGGSGLYADAGGRIIAREADDGSGNLTYEVRLLHLALQP